MPTADRKDGSGGVSSGGSAGKKRRMPEDRLPEIFADVRENLDQGLSARAEEILRDALENYSHSEDNEARLTRYLSYTLETLGRYKDALGVIDRYDNEELLDALQPETQVSVINQLAISLNNTNEHPKAVTLLNYSLEKAEEHGLNDLLGEIYVALARVYRKLTEFPIAIDNARKALKHYREQGNWRGMAESYHTIATAFSAEGNSREALENFQLAIKIIGEHTAPFLLGKIYSDMSGTYWLLRRPKDGIECLEKSIEFFSQTEHKVQTIAAYNNLGINLILMGDWLKAEEMIQVALEIAIDVDHPHISGILDSLGELKLLRNELDEAEELVKQGIKIAEERDKRWYSIQAMRTLARCYLAKREYKKAIKTANENIAICTEMGETQFLNMSRLVLAEAYLGKSDRKKCEAELEGIEDDGAESDLFVLGNVQRIRGMLAESKGDLKIAAHHFNRSLTIFETAEDIYHTALAHYHLGIVLSETQPKKASNHLISASETFRKLQVEHLHESAEEMIEGLDTSGDDGSEASASSQLLMQRLAEATASRELLFRELASVLQQESKANRMIIAEQNEQKRYVPFITHGYTPSESSELVRALNAAGKDLDTFAKTKNLSLNPLRPSNATPAILIVYPRSGGSLQNGGELRPLLRVVELGMDVCALRDRESVGSAEQESSPFTSHSLMPGFIHSSPAMTDLVEEVYKIRSSDVTVLVTGESGTGKELVSRAIHLLSTRKDRAFVPFNCTAVPKELAEGHLFGYKKGAFTGAAQDSPGMIRTADGGTLFLDEIGDLPLDVQPKLLRFLQEGEVQPLGEKRPIKVDVRIIAATNMDLEKQVEQGLFREDLFYRLNVIRLRVPPLRERRSEIEPIVRYYLNHYSSRFSKKNLKITPQTIDLLMVCEWEGNVRQLCNEIQRIVARAEDNEVITPDQLSPELKRSATPLSPVEGSNVSPITTRSGSSGVYTVGAKGATLEEAVSELETQMIQDALRRHNGNISRVSRELGLTRRGLYLKIERYNIERAA
ncbi:MAG: sigma 54-interacting transcriptional regulator [Aridibacter famidurans]|nr:sigma 54-interacting transcriptional regulator [Aridibacter famidurans]